MPVRKNIRWTSAMVARMGLLKRRGLKPRHIVERMQARYAGLPEKTIKFYSGRIFSIPEKSAVKKSFFEWESNRITPEQRSQRAQNAVQTYLATATPKQKSERSKKGAMALTSAQRSERSKKSAMALTPKERSRIAREREMALTSAQRSKRSKKSAKSKRKKLFEFAEYLDELPVLNLLSDAEHEKEFKKLSPLIDSQISKFKRRQDFGDIQQEADIACWIVLSKWDKKMPLEKLVGDSVKKALIEYFSKKKAIEAKELPSKYIEKFES